MVGNGPYRAFCPPYASPPSERNAVAAGGRKSIGRVDQHARGAYPAVIAAGEPARLKKALLVLPAMSVLMIAVNLALRAIVP